MPAVGGSPALHPAVPPAPPAAPAPPAPGGSHPPKHPGLFLATFLAAPRHDLRRGCAESTGSSGPAPLPRPPGGVTAPDPQTRPGAAAASRKQHPPGAGPSLVCEPGGPDPAQGSPWTGWGGPVSPAESWVGPIALWGPSPAAPHRHRLTAALCSVCRQGREGGKQLRHPENGGKYGLGLAPARLCPEDRHSPPQEMGMAPQPTSQRGAPCAHRHLLSLLPRHWWPWGSSRAHVTTGWGSWAPAPRHSHTLGSTCCCAGDQDVPGQ